MYGDFDNQYSETLDTLAGILECPTFDALDEGGGHPGPSMNHHTSASISTNTVNNRSTSVRNQKFVPRPLVATSTSKSPVNSVAEKYLELCINIGEHNISIAEIGILSPQSRIATDGQLFQKIRKAYHQRRGFLRSLNLHLFKPKKVDFVQVILKHYGCQLGLIYSSSSALMTVWSAF